MHKKANVTSDLAKKIISMHIAGATYTEIIIETKQPINRIRHILGMNRTIRTDAQRNFYMAVLDACAQSDTYVQAEPIMKSLIQAGYLTDEKSVENLREMSNYQILKAKRLGKLSLPIVRLAIDLYFGSPSLRATYV